MLAWRISDKELAQRRSTARRRAAERGLDGLLIWSHGGPSVDYYGNVLYLTNHFPPISSAEPDTELWTGRSYSALILPVEGEPILVVDIPDFSREHVAVEDVRPAMHVPDGVAAALLESGMSEGRVGLVGRSSFLANHERAIFKALQHQIDWDVADDILDEMRCVKSDAEIDLMREAAVVGCGWMTSMMDAAVPGATEGEIAGTGLKFLAENGGLAADMDIASGPTGGKLKSRAAIPTWDPGRVLESGDLFHVDGWGSVGGYFTDTVRTTVVEAEVSPERARIIDGTIALVDHLIEGLRPGVRCSEINQRGLDWLRESGFEDQLPDTEDRSNPDTMHMQMWPYFGHGIGLGIDTPWLTIENQTELEPNMVLAVEVYLSTPGVGLAGFEQNVVITDGEPENLTAALRPRWWE